CLPPKISIPDSSKHSGGSGKRPWIGTMRRIPSATFKDHLKLPGHRRLSRSIPKTVRLQRSYCTIRKRSKSHQHRSASSCPRLLHRNRRRCVGNRLTRSEPTMTGPRPPMPMKLAISRVVHLRLLSSEVNVSSADRRPSELTFLSGTSRSTPDRSSPVQPPNTASAASGSTYCL